MARAGHAQPVTLLAHTVLGQPWLPGGSHYILTPLNCISISPDPSPSISQKKQWLFVVSTTLQKGLNGLKDFKLTILYYLLKPHFNVP